MHKRALVVYATRAGSTCEVAQAVSERLCPMGFDAEVQPIESVSSLVGYQAVVMGHRRSLRCAWLPEMTKFIESRRHELAQLPLAVFSAQLQALGGEISKARCRTDKPDDHG